MGLISAKASVKYTINGAIGVAESQVVNSWGTTTPIMIKRIGTPDASGNYSMVVCYPVEDKVPIEYFLKIDEVINACKLDNIIIKDSLWSGEDNGVTYNISEIQIYMNNRCVGSVEISCNNKVVIPRDMILTGYILGEINELSVRTTLQYDQPIDSPSAFIFTSDRKVIWQGFMDTPDIQLELAVQGGGNIVEGIARLKTTWNLNGEPLYIGKAVEAVTTIQNISPECAMRIEAGELSITAEGRFRFLKFAVVSNESRYKVDVLSQSAAISNKATLEVPANAKVEIAYTLRYLG